MNQPSKIEVHLKDGSKHVFKPQYGKRLELCVSVGGLFTIEENGIPIFSRATLTGADDNVKRAYIVTPVGRFILYERNWK